MTKYKGHEIKLNYDGKLVCEDYGVEADSFSELTKLIDAARKMEVVKIKCLKVNVRTRDFTPCVTGKLHGDSAVWITKDDGGRETVYVEYLYLDTPETRAKLTRIQAEISRIEKERNKLDEEMDALPKLEYDQLVAKK